MEFTPMTYKETFHLIQELNTLVDELDGVVLRTQQQYKVQKERMADEHTRNLSKFDEDCQNAVTATRVRAQKLVSEAQEIQNEMRSMDGKLASVDKYYVKTKRNAPIQSDFLAFPSFYSISHIGRISNPASRILSIILPSISVLVFDSG